MWSKHCSCSKTLQDRWWAGDTEENRQDWKKSIPQFGSKRPSVSWVEKSKGPPSDQPLSSVVVILARIWSFLWRPRRYWRRSRRHWWQILDPLANCCKGRIWTVPCMFSGINRLRPIAVLLASTVHTGSEQHPCQPRVCISILKWPLVTMT